jgi:hypothetical protein
VGPDNCVMSKYSEESEAASVSLPNTVTVPDKENDVRQRRG